MVSFIGVEEKVLHTFLRIKYFKEWCYKTSRWKRW